MSDYLQKYAALATGSAKVNRLIIANIADYAQIQAMLEEFVANPTADLAEELDSQFNKVTAGLDAVKNAVSKVANMVVGTEAEDEVDVTFDERGARLL